jgi:hypothetical protein
MLCRVALVRTDVSDELSASFIRATFVGNGRVEAHIRSNARATKTEPLKTGISFGVPPLLLKLLLGRINSVKTIHSSVQEFQLKESSTYKKIEETSVEAKTSGIAHGSREVGRKTSQEDNG